MEKENKAKNICDEQAQKPRRKIKIKQETEEQPIEEEKTETPKAEEIENLNCEQQKYYEIYLKNNPYRIKEVWDILDKLIVGEENNKKVIFYNLLSCKLPQPNGTIVVGNSSSGKTHMVRETIKMIPKHMVRPIGGMSKKALIHMKGQVNPINHEKIIDLTGTILWFLEETGGEESYDYLRPILSRDQEEIRFELPTKKKGKGGSEFFQNDVIIVKGCPAYITTSTKESRLAETGTRVFLLSPDESKEQSDKIVKKKIENQKFIQDDIDFAPFHQFIRELKTYDVWIPFADIIDINTQNLNVRRDIDKIFALLKSHVLFNQEDHYKVIIKGKEYLIATINDYIYVMDILLPIIKPTLFNLPKKIIDFYEKLCVTNCILTHKDISLALGMNQNTVRNYCWELVIAGYLVFRKDGRENVYEIVPDKKDVLPSVTLKEITQNMIDISRESTKQWLIQSVTENQVLYISDNVSVEDVVMLSFLVTDNTSSQNGIINQMAKQNSVTEKKVTQVTHESQVPVEVKVEDII